MGAGSGKFSVGNVGYERGLHQQGWEGKVALNGEKTAWTYSGPSENNGTYPLKELEQSGKTWGGAREVEEGIL